MSKVDARGPEANSSCRHSGALGRSRAPQRPLRPGGRAWSRTQQGRMCRGCPPRRPGFGLPRRGSAPRVPRRRRPWGSPVPRTRNRGRALRSSRGGPCRRRGRRSPLSKTQHSLAWAYPGPCRTRTKSFRPRTVISRRGTEVLTGSTRPGAGWGERSRPFPGRGLGASCR
jgi:hypothetical protein